MSDFNKIQSRESGLKRRLTARQMTMIAIGGCIGTGLFLGSKLAVGIAGPGVLISYVIAGAIALLLMGCLAEMTIEHSTSGSFGAYAEHYISPLSGFIVRYCYWSCIVLGVGTEVTAVASYMQFWFPDIAPVFWIIGFSAVLIAVNAYSVKAFGSFEYWFSAIKVFAIIAFIVVGIGVLFAPVHESSIIENLTGSGGFLPHGWTGVWVAVIVAIFSYFSIEMIAVAAAESEEPEKAVRTAFKATLLRLVIFYLGSLAVILMLVPWQALIAGDSTSPYVTVMQSVGIPYADSVLNFVVIVAALSSMNSMLYVSTRMMFSLSRAGDAPEILGHVRGNGVPLNALIISASGIGVAAVVYSMDPDTAFAVMISLSMFGALCTWGMIFVTHLFFRACMNRDGTQLKFKIMGFPVTTMLGAISILAIMITSWFTDLFHAMLPFGLPFLAFLIVVYLVRRAIRGHRSAELPDSGS